MRRYKLIPVLLVVLLAGAPACRRGKSVAVTANPAANAANHEVITPTMSEYIRAVLRISQENSVSAEESLKRLQEHRPELGELAHLVSRHARDVQTRLLLAEAYLDERLFLKAFQLFQEVEAIAPGNAEAHLGIARVWDNWGDHSLAYRHAERAASLDPYSARAWETMGRIQMRRNELPQAITSFQRALRLEPDNASILSNVGYVYLLRNDMNGAREYLQRAIQADRSLEEAQNNLGIVLGHLGDSDGALRAFSATAPPAVALNNLGVVYLSQKRWDEARRAFQGALRIDGDYEKAKINLAEAESHLPAPTVVHLDSLESRGTVRMDVVATPEDRKPVEPKSAGRNEVVPGKVVRLSTGVGRPIRKRTARITAAYIDAIDRYQKRKYRESIEILSWVLSQNPDKALASRCDYWLGESYFGLKDYSNALAAFKRVANYGASPKRREALVMMKRTYAKLRQEKGNA